MKRRLMVILLSLTLIFTLIPMTAFADDETVTITLKATTIDGKTPVSDYKLQIPKGLSLNDFFWSVGNRSKKEEIKNYFSTDTYVPITKLVRDDGYGKVFYDNELLMLTKSISSYKDSDYYKVCEDGYTEYYKENNEDRILYVPMAKVIKTVNLKLERPVCGTKVETKRPQGELTNEQTNKPKVTVSSSYYDYFDSMWVSKIDKENRDIVFMNGTFDGEKEYSLIAGAMAKVGYTFKKDAKVNIENATVLDSSTEGPDDSFIIIAVANGVKPIHNWDEGEVTKEPTLSAEGVKTYTCKGCKKTRTESIPKLQKGSDGTEVGAGASAELAEDKITGMKTDKDPKGSKFNKLRLRSTKQSKTSITLKWKSNKKAVKYVIYGNRCGSSTKIRKSVKLYTVKKSTKTTMTKVIKKIKGAKLKKNTYYKFLIVALNKNNKVVSTSRMIHVATKGGKYTNYKSISVKKDKITKAKNLKKGKSLKLEPTQVKVTKSLKARKHVPIRYESSNKTIAKVTSKGVIKALKKGTCYVYVYAQNGVYKKVRVVVK
ncbi:MAG: hypothetical protein IIU36_05000 [Firmicutes bacterium]|nr:hypothetical protein [Bacillota bacterium]